MNTYQPLKGLFHLQFAAEHFLGMQIAYNCATQE